MLHFLLNGVDFSAFGLLADRLAVGTFFTLAGAHKIFFRDKRAVFLSGFEKWGLRSPAWAYLIPGGEFFGGLGLIVGALAVPAALGLLIICSGACILDAFGRVQSKRWHERMSDYLYLPEVLYLVMLAFILAQGAGVYSLDALFLGGLK